MLSILVLLALQEKPKVEHQATVEKNDVVWTFRVSGTTNVPDGTVLRGRGYALDEIQDPQSGNMVWEEEALYYNDEAWDSFEVEKGAVKGNLYRMPRKPYSLRYRVRLLYDPEYQNKTVRAKVGDEKIQWDYDFRLGDDDKYKQELKDAAADLRAEFEEVKRLYDELKREFTAQQAKPDVKAWEAWLKSWGKKVNEVADRNDSRFMLWTVWIERQGKLRIDGFTGRLPELAGDCTDHLKGEKDALERAQHHLTAFLEYYEEAIEVVGLEMPLDVQTIGPALAEYEKALKIYRDFAVKPDAAAWEKIRAGIKRDGSESLLTVAGTLGTRKKAYERLNILMTRFTGLLKLGDAGSTADALKKALDAHDLALKDFKDFAGLK